jgi:hypothetical protein
MATTEIMRFSRNRLRIELEFDMHNCRHASDCDTKEVLNAVLSSLMINFAHGPASGPLGGKRGHVWKAPKTVKGQCGI